MKSIRAKIVLVLFVLLTLVVATQAVRFYLAEKELLQQQADILRTKTAQDWAMACERNYRLKNYGVDVSFLLTHDANNIVTAACYTSSGETFSALTPEKLAQSLTPDELKFANLLFSGKVTREDVPNYGEELLVTEMPINLMPSGRILARIYFSRTFENEALDRQHNIAIAKIYGVSAIALIAAYLSLLFVTQLFVNPIEAIARGAREIASGNLKYRIKVGSRDELGQLAQELNQMAEKMSELERLKEDFISGITHDLRSPVTGIKLAAGNIIREYRMAKFTRIPEQVFLVEENAERLNRLIDMLLRVSKIESGKETLSLKKCSVEEIISGIIQANRPYAAEKHLPLDLIVENETADICIDPEKMEQALANLITNSLKFTDTGAVLVYIRQHADTLQVRVSDTGCGIAPEQRRHMFEKFQKGTNSPTGSGLGLYLAKKIIELHKGTIDYKSVPGKGTEFTVVLPRNTECL